MKRLLSVLLFLLLAAAAFSAILYYAQKHEATKEQESRPIEKVVIYTDIQSGILEALSQAFYKDTGLEFEIYYVSSDQMKGQGEAGNTPADVYITSQESLIALKEKEKLSPYSSSQTDTALETFRDRDSYWTGLWVDPVVFAVNREFLNKHPAFSYTWEEVMSRQSVKLSMTDFIATDMSKDLLMCLAEHFGMDDTFRFLKSAQQHVVQYGKYLSTPSRMAAMGKCDIGISGFNEVIRTQHENMPVAVIYPEDGSPWYLYGVGLSATSQEKERGQLLIDWLLVPSHYKAIMHNNQYDYIYINDNDSHPDVAGNSLVLWDLEKIYFEEGKKDLLNQWGEKVRFGGTKS